MGEIDEKTSSISHSIIAQNPLNIIALFVRIWYYNVSGVIYMLRIAVCDDELEIAEELSVTIKKIMNEINRPVLKPLKNN